VNVANMGLKNRAAAANDSISSDRASLGVFQ
jgi:hypothetical protein